MVARRGFEPRLPGPEPGVPTTRRSRKDINYFIIRWLRFGGPGEPVVLPLDDPRIIKLFKTSKSR
jgi:hypothetical protein